ncbi:MAG: NUDIX domain-containing protein [Bacteroidetes bacterium]|nr:NUDIX domain-containing protein [Bacteroidota bacterium]
MHTVFVNDKSLHFIHTYLSGELEMAKNHLVISEANKNVEDVILLLENTDEPLEVFYISENPDVAWKTFVSNCTLIEASGGLVRHAKNEFLFIFRLGKWDLPKGKIEFDETPEEAAIREVEEECGIKELSIVQKLPPTFHTYWLRKRMLKKTHWFLMDTTSDSPLVPQLDEHITDVKWMTREELMKEVFFNTYSSMAELLRIFFSEEIKS